MVSSSELFFDQIVIGSGLAGLTSALRSAEAGFKVAVITKGAIDDCNTKYAQGGIACVLDHKDSFAGHIHDTLEAGADLCKPEIVKAIVEAGPEHVQWLVDKGVHFTTRGEIGDDSHKDDFHLGREGGHHERRVIHAGDITGEEVEGALVEAVRSNPNIKVFERHMAIDLITTWRLGWMGDNCCIGAYVLDIDNNQIATFGAYATVIATGGVGKAYLYTSNPDGACGDGVAMCYRANAAIANMEFLQFHPTILYSAKMKSFLLSEALRGEGAVLKRRDESGKLAEFMQDYHEMGSLAPRDIVARAIDNELKRSGQPCAYLDMRGKDEEFLRKRFPHIFEKCLEAGFNLARNPIPAVPAAHFSCGGVKTDVNGFTGIHGLYAAGEAACTGLHGANRLASNSLLEALVVPDFVTKHIVARLPELKAMRPDRSPPQWSCGDATNSDEMVVIAHNWDEIRRFMWDYVGIVRTDKRLERAKSRITNIRREIEKYYWDFLITRDLIELRDMASVAELIIDSAMARRESRGLHYNADFPSRDPKMDGVDTIIQKPYSAA